MNALNLEMQGRTTMAQLVQQNPARSSPGSRASSLSTPPPPARVEGAAEAVVVVGEPVSDRPTERRGTEGTEGTEGTVGTGQLPTGGNNPMGRNTVNMPGNASTCSRRAPSPSWGSANNQPSNSAIGNIQDPSYA